MAEAWHIFYLQMSMKKAIGICIVAITLSLQVLAQSNPQRDSLFRKDSLRHRADTAVHKSDSAKYQNSSKDNPQQIPSRQKDDRDPNFKRGGWRDTVPR